jgi:hypothetical protein
MEKREVLQAIFHTGVELLGSALSFRRSAKSSAVATDVGVEITSKSTGRIVVVPYSNVRCLELQKL